MEDSVPLEGAVHDHESAPILDLHEHERRSAERARCIKHKINKLDKHIRGNKMSTQTPEVNIFQRDGLGGMLPAMCAPGAGVAGGLGAGLGAGLLGGVLGGALFGGRGRRGGLFGDDDCGNGGAETRIEDTVFNTAVLAKLGTIEAAVPLAAANTENVILQQTNLISNIAAAAQLANQTGFSNLKDSVQLTSAALAVGINNVNQNVLTTGCSIERVISAENEKTRGLITQIFETQQAEKINKLNAEVIELREEGRRNEAEARRVTDVNALRSTIEINNTATNTTNQQQQQFQVQSQFQTIGNVLSNLNSRLDHITQIAQATNQNIIAGNTGAVVTGPQAANPTNVNTR